MGCPSASDFAEMDARIRASEKRIDEKAKKVAPIVAEMIKVFDEADAKISYIDFLLFLSINLQYGFEFSKRVLDDAVYGWDRYLYTDNDGNLHALSK